MTGASRGLGKALVQGLLGRGYRVGACARSQPPDLDGAYCRSVDVGDWRAVDTFAREVVEAVGPIDLWINNAGVLGPLGPLASTDLAEWETCLRVNVLGVVHGSRALLAHRSSPGSLLVNIASRAGVRGLPGLAAYSASKAAVIALTASLAEEADSSGTRIMAIVPPSVETDMQNTLQDLDERTFPLVKDWRRRRREGGIADADAAAELILDAALSEDGVEGLLDLTV